MNYVRVLIFASFSALCACVIMVYTDYLFPPEDVVLEPCPFYSKACEENLDYIIK